MKLKYFLSLDPSFKPTVENILTGIMLPTYELTAISSQRKTRLFELFGKNPAAIIKTAARSNRRIIPKMTKTPIAKNLQCCEFFQNFKYLF